MSTRRAKEAKKNAEREAKYTAELVPCPHCRKRDPSAVRGHVIGAAILVLVVLGLAGWLATLVVDHDSQVKTQIFAGIGALICVAVGIGAVMNARDSYDKAASKATFSGVVVP